MKVLHDRARRWSTVLCASLFLLSPTQALGQEKLQVLFIGNSLTYYHDLPRMVADLARAGKQRPLVFEKETPGGCSLEKHWRNGKAMVKLQSRRWDFVVLQDHSQGPVQKREAMFEYARKFDAEIKKHGARTMLYMTWARRNQPDTQPIIRKAYQDLAGELKAQLVPVGNAWQAALEKNKDLMLHDPDQLHPSKMGTYLAACVFYAVLYGRSPEGLPGGIGGLTDEQARPLQALAWKMVQAQSPGN